LNGRARVIQIGMAGWDGMSGFGQSWNDRGESGWVEKVGEIVNVN
jgi:predicted acetyltransferase